MNCKPGDLAVILRDSTPTNVGKFIKCLYLDPTWLSMGVLTWEFEPVSHGLPSPERFTMDDKDLRPIRDPGEDARDETLNWLPVPTKEHA